MLSHCFSPQEFFLRVAIVLVCLALNIRGLEVVTTVLGVCMVTVMSPFLVYFLMNM